MLFLNTKSHICNALKIRYCAGNDRVCDVWGGKTNECRMGSNVISKLISMTDRNITVCLLPSMVSTNDLIDGGLWMTEGMRKVMGRSKWEEQRGLDRQRRGIAKGFEKIIKIGKV